MSLPGVNTNENELNEIGVIFTHHHVVTESFSPILKLYKNLLGRVMKSWSAIQRRCISMIGLCLLLIWMHKGVFSCGSYVGRFMHTLKCIKFKDMLFFYSWSMCTSDCTHSIVSRCVLSPLPLSLPPSLFSFLLPPTSSSLWTLLNILLPSTFCVSSGSTYPITCLIHL